VAGLQPPQHADEDFSWDKQGASSLTRCRLFSLPSPDSTGRSKVFQSHKADLHAFPSGSGGSSSCHQPALCLCCDYLQKGTERAALLPKTTLSVALDLGDYISPL